MTLDKKDVLADIDAVLAYAPAGAGSVQELITHVHSCICRYAPLASTHRKQADRYYTMGFTAAFDPRDALKGVLRSLRSEIDVGCLRTFESLVSADIFADLLEQADELVASHYRLASMVLAGATLEEHLRKLAISNSVSVVDASGKPLKASVLNDELYKTNVYSKAEHAQIGAWQKSRNSAAHGEASFERDHTDADVTRAISGIREFIVKHPS